MVVSYEPKRQLLTIRNATGSTTYRVAPDARAWLGRRSVPLLQIAAHLGDQATVAWAEVDGVPTTHTVRLRPSGTAPER